jgi:MEDS: MEthanogen/methylotroph, DcmR Sensory domain
MLEIKSEDWQKSNLQVFWAELAPCDHVVQIYETDKVFLDSLEGFIGSGIIAGDAIIIIATAEHLKAIEVRLKKQGFDLDSLSYSSQYMGLDVNEMLSVFMVNDWPQANLFFERINSLVEQVRKNNRKVRAFGEMVAVLWQRGLYGATVHLEKLWDQLHKKEEFTLFCAYPKIGFTQDVNSSIKLICSEHSKIIDGNPRPSTEIYYKAV